MRKVSLKITETLYRILEEKANQLEISLSEIMRDCLTTGLNHLDSGQSQQDVFENHSPFFQKRTAIQTLFTFCLLEEYVKNVTEDGSAIIAKAESNAKKMVSVILNKHQEIQ